MYKDTIKFLESNDNMKVYIVCISNTLVKFEFDENNRPSNDILLSGFEVLNERTFENQSDDYYHGYTTLYRDIDENTVILSNDGSVYVEPEPFPEPKPYVPTLEEVKDLKIQSLSSICKQSIINGVDVEIDGVVEHFSYGEEDQVNIKELFDLAMQTNVPLYYHADGESCKLYTVEQIVNIYTTNATNKMHHITYFNQLKLYVNTLETNEDVESVNYGDELTGEYLKTYNDAMVQANVGLTTLLGGE